MKIIKLDLEPSILFFALTEERVDTFHRGIREFKNFYRIFDDRQYALKQFTIPIWVLNPRSVGGGKYTVTEWSYEITL